MKTSTARTQIATLAITCLLLSGLAAAEGIKANLNFPEGLPAGKEVPVTASLEGDISSLKRRLPPCTKPVRMARASKSIWARSARNSKGN
jgi:hypothetical protein